MYENATCSPKQAGHKTFKCFFELSQMIIGGKWKPKVLFYLAQQDVMRFGELRDAINGISEKMLIQQLKELVEDGIVHREVYRQVPPKVEYSLTPIGRTLIPIMETMFAWGQQYASHLVASTNNKPISPGDVLTNLEELVRKQTEELTGP